MNVEIRTETPIFLFWEYLFRNLWYFVFAVRPPLIPVKSPHTRKKEVEIKLQKFSNHMFLVTLNDSLDPGPLNPN
jgi:hypothetical protein